MSLAFRHALRRKPRLTVGQLSLRQKSHVVPKFNHPRFVAAAATFDEVPALNGEPEVIVTGRANCGKSTLFNLVLETKKMMKISKKAGCTKSLNFYRVLVGSMHLVLVDSPGYGARGRREWGEMFNSYISTRKQLRRIYICFNAKHLLNDVDLEMIAYLSKTLQERTQPCTLQPVITKVDTIPVQELAQNVSKMQEQIRSAAPSCPPPILTSSWVSLRYGIERVRENISEVCGVFQKRMCSCTTDMIDKFGCSCGAKKIAK
ncbi:P-loop containing nucleoside triphosphate hydrolase protein [Mycena pura]|uniref:P-loop containing nucleoside triphosphate hydrolase protein n=1 Tax=Mycena pura TaxID=153505 RepID=A0AAD6YVU6_9AGAR|nr:P-loop containing nucleoside triphosphate hydrolase protein [Mycena pura]